MTIPKHLSRASLAALALLLVVGCDERHGKPGDYAFVKRQISPSGALQARIVKWRELADVPEETYFVDVAPSTTSRDSVTIANVREKTSVLHARNAAELQLAWRSDSDLVVTCNACGMKQGDVLKSATRSGPVRVSFVGVPGA